MTRVRVMRWTVVALAVVLPVPYWLVVLYGAQYAWLSGDSSAPAIIGAGILFAVLATYFVLGGTRVRGTFRRLLIALGLVAASGALALVFLGPRMHLGPPT